VISKILTREEIVRALQRDLEPIEYIYAFWQSGSIAFDRVDQWSDIDLQLVVDDEKVKETFADVERSLTHFSSIEQKYYNPEVPEAFYRLRNAGEYLIIDLAILKQSAPEKFLEPRIHGDLIFYFNKSNRVTFPEWDDVAWRKRLEARSKRLKERFRLFNNHIEKEIKRGNHLEAIDLYYNLTLATLLEELRIKHNPFHYDFKMRYVHYELPRDVLDRLEKLYFVGSPAELEEKYHEASKWFSELSKNS
jgi:hypothetical protein